jgi:hypothetical protein
VPVVVDADRYLLPLREGGSLPAVVETHGAREAGGRYAVKFLGAGQGARALIAELIVGGIAGRLGLPVPELAIVDVAAGFGRAEPDPEIQEILRASVGPNVGLRFVDGALPYDPVAAADLIEPDMAAEIVWLDALVMNVDRTARNPNMLVAGSPARLWLIDHGAALYFHHDWPSVTPTRATGGFPAIREHVLLPRASSVQDADSRLAPRLSGGVLWEILMEVPDDMLMHVPPGHTPAFENPGAHREAYRDWFLTRLAEPREWVRVADEARGSLASTARTPVPYRR